MLRSRRLPRLPRAPPRRACSSPSSAQSPSIGAFARRVLLVGGSVGLCTPVFAIGGVVQIWRSVLPKTTQGRVLKTGLGILAGGGISTLVATYALPFLQNNAELVLPFALCNAVAASSWYALSELVFGLPAVLASPSIGFASLRIPLFGGSLGLLTALTAPALWPAAFSLVWSEDLQRIIFADDKVRTHTLAMYSHS